MLRPAIPLDSARPVSEALARPWTVARARRGAARGSRREGTAEAAMLLYRRNGSDLELDAGTCK
jgi:hypothetical protein